MVLHVASVRVINCTHENLEAQSHPHMEIVLILVPKELTSQIRKPLTLWEAGSLCGTKPRFACDPVADLSVSISPSLWASYDQCV